MKKKGVSLIVLVITVIVIIILAMVIIINITKNNPIAKAKEAVDASDLKIAQEAFVIWLGNRWMANDNDASYTNKEIGALYSGVVTNSSSNIEVELNGNISTISITLADLGLSNLEEVEIKDNQVIRIKKNGKSYNGSSGIKYSSIIKNVDFKVSDIKNNNLKVNVEISVDNESDISEYHILARKVNDSKNSVSKVSNTKEIFLEKLEPDTEYNIMVIAYDKYNHLKYSSTQIVKTLAEFDFIEKFPTTVGTLTSFGNDEYYALIGTKGYFSTNGFGYLSSTNPTIHNSDKGSYVELYTKNNLEHDYKYIEIEVRTRNNGANNGTAWIGLYNLEQNKFADGSCIKWTAATTNSWSTYKTIMEIPDGIKASEWKLRIHLNHNANFGYDMAMDFITLKGLY